MPASVTRSGPLNCRMRAMSPRPVSHSAVSVARASASGALGVDQEGDGRHVGERRLSRPVSAGGEASVRLDTAAATGRRPRTARRSASYPATPLRACTRNSTLPARAGQGGGHRPHDAGSGRRRVRTSPLRGRPARRPGSRTTPLPRETAARPASNWGLTSSTRSAPGAATGPHSAGTTVRSEMNDRSAITSGHGSNAGSARPQLVERQRPHVRPARARHPGVARRRGSSCPCPRRRRRRGPPRLEQAVGEAAGRGTGVEGAPVR